MFFYAFSAFLFLSASFIACFFLVVINRVVIYACDSLACAHGKTCRAALLLAGKQSHIASTGRGGIEQALGSLEDM